MKEGPFVRKKLGKGNPAIEVKKNERKIGIGVAREGLRWRERERERERE